jgi:hypothetical protein
MLKFRNKVLFGASEDVYGVEETLVAADAVLTRDLSWEPSKGDSEELTYDNGGIGHGVNRKTASHVGTSFKVDLAGSGTPGNAPALGFLLKACGFAQVLTPGVSAAYNFSNSSDSLTLAFHNAGNKHVGVGARGMVKFDLTPKRHPFAEFNFEALRVAPANAAFPAVNQAAWRSPQAVNFANTTVAQLFGHNVILTACSFDIGNQVPVINVPGAQFVDVNRRAPVASITILDPGISQKDFYEIEHDGVLGAFSLVHGQGAGNIFTFADPTNTQISGLTVGEYEGYTALSMTLRFVDGAAGLSTFNIVNT